MKIIVLALALVAACAAPRRNLAVELVHNVVDPDARCDRYFTDEGPEHAHSASCRIPATRQVLYCSIAADKWPMCKPLIEDGQKATAASSSASSAPKPAPTGPGAPPPPDPPKP
jgi:hypothetical protein